MEDKQPGQLGAERLEQIIARHVDRLREEIRQEFAQRIDDAESESAMLQDQVSLLRQHIDKLEARLQFQPKPNFKNVGSSSVQNNAPYTMAIQMAKKGFSKEELVSACHLTESEAELIMALHHRVEAQKTGIVAAS